MWRFKSVYGFLSLWSLTVAANDLTSHPVGIWSIDPTPEMQRWVVIHHREQAKTTGIYHIEVIGRKPGDATWQVIRLVRHMAITEAALQASVREPLNRGAVYPESFNEAYAEWQRENEGQGGTVCRLSVVECL